MKKFLFILTLFASTISLLSQSLNEALTVNTNYTADNLAVVNGGLKQGYSYLGLAQIHLTLDAEKAGWWRGGEFFMNAADTHGNSPSETLIGDLQTVSNIEAGEHTYIQELWFKQRFKRFEITIGLQDLNEELANFESGGLFVHSSFGILPIIAMNVEAPIFPLTSPGITTKWLINDRTTWLNALYKGTPNDFDVNPYNLKWAYNKGDGALFVSELQREINLKDKEGVFKFGFFSHSHLYDKKVLNVPADSAGHYTAGLFASYDQIVYKEGDKTVGAFLQTGYSPTDESLNDFYLGFGANLNGFLSKNQDDQLGVAMAYDQLNGFGHESFIELTWKKPITENFYVQPDIQYIINPGGSNSGIKNALVGIIRFGFEI